MANLEIIMRFRSEIQ